MAVSRILIVRLGALGDILHALPAASTLKKSFPDAHLAWAVAPKWREVLEGNGLVDELIPIDRKSIGGVLSAWRRLRAQRFDVAVDFQGLVQSALVATVARASRVIGYKRGQLREPAASMFYTDTVHAESAHVIDRNLELCAAAGAMHRCYEAPLPAGRAEGELPNEPFVLASPLAGWASKQWPLENYAALARLLRERMGMALVLNGAPSSEAQLRSVPGARVHLSSVAGLIDATRRAAAVVGVDSGPMHLASALGKPGVAIFGPTDPRRNGPYSKSFAVLRSDAAAATYKRDAKISDAMRKFTAQDVMCALQEKMREHTTAQRQD